MNLILITMLVWLALGPMLLALMAGIYLYRQDGSETEHRGAGETVETNREA